MNSVYQAVFFKQLLELREVFVLQLTAAPSLARVCGLRSSAILISGAGVISGVPS